MIKILTREEAFAMLEEYGLDPQWCDTPVPFYDVPVSCGNPTLIGDLVMGYKPLPKDMVDKMDGFMTRAKGDSMKDAGIIDGDTVLTDKTDRLYDGDIVVAMVDGEYLIKCFCVDTDGQAWLVPQNENYQAIPLKEENDCYIMGIVTEVIRRSPRINAHACMRFIEEAKKQQNMPKRFTPQQTSRVIGAMASEIKVGRHWFGVYRIMADLGIVGKDDFEAFCEKVVGVVPMHKHLPKQVEMSRLNIGCFKKPFDEWTVETAPVKGKRYMSYYMAAQQTKNLFEKGHK